MIKNPQIGQRIRVVFASLPIHNCKGRIHHISDYGTIYVILDGREALGTYHISPYRLILEDLSIEEQNLLNRERHADKYL